MVESGDEGEAPGELREPERASHPGARTESRGTGGEGTPGLDSRSSRVSVGLSGPHDRDGLSGAHEGRLQAPAGPKKSTEESHQERQKVVPGLRRPPLPAGSNTDPGTQAYLMGFPPRSAVAGVAPPAALPPQGSTGRNTVALPPDVFEVVRGKKATHYASLDRIVRVVKGHETMPRAVQSRTNVVGDGKPEKSLEESFVSLHPKRSPDETLEHFQYEENLQRVRDVVDSWMMPQGRAMVDEWSTKKNEHAPVLISEGDVSGSPLIAKVHVHLETIFKERGFTFAERQRALVRINTLADHLLLDIPSDFDTELWYMLAGLLIDLSHAQKPTPMSKAADPKDTFESVAIEGSMAASLQPGEGEEACKSEHRQEWVSHIRPRLRRRGHVKRRTSVVQEPVRGASTLTSPASNTTTMSEGSNNPAAVAQGSSPGSASGKSDVTMKSAGASSADGSSNESMKTAGASLHSPPAASAASVGSTPPPKNIQVDRHAAPPSEGLTPPESQRKVTTTSASARDSDHSPEEPEKVEAAVGNTGTEHSGVDATNEDVESQAHVPEAQHDGTLEDTSIAAFSSFESNAAFHLPRND